MIGAAVALTMLLADPVDGRDFACRDAVERVDFGSLPFALDIPRGSGRAALPAECEDECVYIGPDGVRNVLVAWAVMDKQLEVGSGRPLPWGLRGDEGRDEVAEAMAKILPGPAVIDRATEGAVYTLAVPGCGAWIEVTFEAERRIKAVSLSAQP